MNWYKLTQNNDLQNILNKWQQQGIDLYVYEKDGTIILNSLIVPKEKRKQGIGSQIMKELINYADKNNKRLELTPGVKDPYQGTTSRKRLIDFYKRFGLIENKGRNKDYSLSNYMYRKPKNMSTI